MKSLWEESARRELSTRLERLTPAHDAKWGRMSAGQMVVHLADSCRMMFGEIACAGRWMPFRYPPLKQLIIYWLPFPKSAPTAPELIARQPGDWGTEVQDLQAMLDRFVKADPNGAWPDHPAFGPMSGRQWGVLAYRHVDHHLRQFGV